MYVGMRWRQIEEMIKFGAAEIESLALSRTELNSAADESVVVSGVETCGVVGARLRGAGASVWIARPIIASQLNRHQISWLWWAHIW